MKIEISKAGLSIRHSNDGTNIGIQNALPHPCPLPLGEGEWLSDGLIRRNIAAVQGVQRANELRGSLSGRLAGRAGLSLVEMMIVMGIFSLLIAGMVAGQLYSLRVYTQVATKLVSTADARQVMNGIRDQLREANAVYIGNCSSNWATYADITNGARQGNAVEIYPTTATNNYLICYLDTTAATNRLMLYNSSLGTVQQLARYITNRMVFDAEDLYGNILTNNRNGKVICMTLQFSQWEYPIGGTNFNSFNHYQLRTSAARRSVH